MTYYYPIFKHPFTLIISGATGSGKTEWLMRLLNNTDELIEPAPHNVLYCYGEWNANIMRLERGEANSATLHVDTHRGVPDEALLRARAREKGPLLLVLDDLLTDMEQARLNTLFTRGSHNWGVSVVVVTQHLFSPELRVARNNAHYLVLMRNPVGESQISNLATQLFRARRDLLLEAYRNATAKQFSYLLIDMHPNTDEEMRLKTHIYPDERPIIVYN